jgi:hypothetical protein
MPAWTLVARPNIPCRLPGEPGGDAARNEDLAGDGSLKDADDAGGRHVACDRESSGSEDRPVCPWAWIGQQGDDDDVGPALEPRHGAQLVARRERENDGAAARALGPCEEVCGFICKEARCLQGIQQPRAGTSDSGGDGDGDVHPGLLVPAPGRVGLVRSVGSARRVAGDADSGRKMSLP